MLSSGTIRILAIFAACALTATAAHAQPIELMTVSENEIVRPADPERAISFGNAIAADGDLAVIGAPGDTTNGLNAGAAYVFRFDGTNWIEGTKLLASDGQPDEKFANAVALSGSTAIIGARGNNDAGLGVGAAYIFRFDGAQWVEEAKLIPSDADQTPFAFFGTSVAIDGDTAIVGAPGSTNDFGTILGSSYIFRYDGKQWVEESKLTASDEMQDDGFGGSVAISGNTCLVGASGVSLGGNGDGAAYVFRFDGTDWIQESPRLEPPDHNTRFGAAVALSDDLAIIGIPAGVGDSRGGARIYRFDGTGWAQEATLSAPDGMDYDRLGSSIDLSDGLVLIGSSHSNGDFGFDTGAGYLFHNEGSDWTLRAKLTKGDGITDVNDYFGSAVALSGTQALVGAYRNRTIAGTAGAVYSYDTTDLPCPQDFNGDGTSDVFDVFAFLQAYRDEDPSADWHTDDEFTVNDIFDYIEVFNTHSPGCL